MTGGSNPIPKFGTPLPGLASAGGVGGARGRRTGRGRAGNMAGRRVQTGQRNATPQTRTRTIRHGGQVFRPSRTAPPTVPLGQRNVRTVQRSTQQQARNIPDDIVREIASTRDLSPGLRQQLEVMAHMIWGQTPEYLDRNTVRNKLITMLPILERQEQ